jgi:anhydro-N-acetylmuramic acid kinase
MPGMDSQRKQILGLALGRSGLGLEACLVEACATDGALSFDRRAADWFACDASLHRDLEAWIWSEQVPPQPPLRKLGGLCGDAVEAICRRASVDRSDLSALGWLGPVALESEICSVLCEDLHCPVVGGMRASDRLAGGLGGAPEAWAIWKLVRDDRLSRAVLRIGAMAELFFVGAGCDEVETVAGALGPACCLLDWAAREHFDLACDFDGAMAAKGKVDAALLNELLSHHWFELPLPRLARPADWSGTYRKRVEMMAGKHQTRPQDVLATLTEMTAQLALAGISSMTERPHQVALVGGGSANITLAGRIRALLSPTSTVSGEVLGLEPRGSRAQAGAMLAAARLASRRIWCPQATGAKAPALLGTVVYPKEF